MKGFKKVKEFPFQFRPDWYYYAMWYFPFPPSPDHLLGGNVTGLIWRLMDEPDCWRMTYRFRYYNSKAIDDPKDTRSWYGFHGRDADAPKKFMEGARLICSLKPMVFDPNVKPNEPDQFDYLLIDGGLDKLFETVEREKKPWLTMRRAKPGEYDGLATRLGMKPK